MGAAWAKAKAEEANFWLAAQAAWHVAAVAEAEARRLEALAHEAAARACQARADEVRSRIPTHRERGTE
jgi:hypothetical protein